MGNGNKNINTIYLRMAEPGIVNAKTDTKTPDLKTKSSALGSGYKDLQDFLFKHRYVKPADGENDAHPITHTRIPSKKDNIPGGSFHIPDEESNLFMQLYYDAVLSKKTIEHLTEKQLMTGGPIAIDLDFHLPLEVDKRLYTHDHVVDLIDAYLVELKTIYQLEADTKFPIFIFAKPDVNRVKEKNITKDGVHMIIGIQMDRTAQCILRKRILERVPALFTGFPLVNTWNEVFDEGISAGHTNWQLYGSRKPNHDAYILTHVYEIEYDMEYGEFSYNSASPAEYLTAERISELSVRYTKHPQFFYRSAFLQELAAAGNGEVTGRRRATPPPENTFLVGESDHVSVQDIHKIRTREQLDHCLHSFLDSISTREYYLREIYEYTMVLPETYYGEGSYTKWIRVGWALKNYSTRLLIVWLAFSAKSSTFRFTDIPDLCNQWSSFERKQGGVTNRSIIYWARHDNRDGYDAVHKNTLSHLVDQTINRISSENVNKSDRNAKGCGDYDLAVVLHQMYKDEYVCADVKNNIWYRFRNHRWKQIDSASTLRLAISKELRDLYEKRAEELANYKSTLDPEDEKYKIISARIEIVLKIYLRLGQTSDKKNIMQEAKDLFYDSDFDFHNRLDSNPYLLCFNNGVMDFKEGIFRRGLPEDYLTKCTGIDYYPMDSPRHTTVANEITDFMAKLFPQAELREYMWDHLSSVLIGTASVNQTFNNYIGVGANGKSVLTDLMSQTLGNYKVSAPISIMTQPRVKVGGASPEIAALQGARYVVMQEPSKGDVIHEGPMKEYVSGVEPITARGLFKDPVTFIPQCKFVVCCNEFMGVKSNDEGTWRRLRVVPFVAVFTEHPVQNDPNKPYQFQLDRHLKDKFPVWRETFASMLVARALKTNGVVNDCDIVLSASHAYRDRQDYLSEFVRDKIVRCQGASVRKSQLSEEFKVWYSINFGTRNPSPKDLHDYMDRTFGKQRGGVWLNVKLKYNDDEDDQGGADDVEDDITSEINLDEL